MNCSVFKASLRVSLPLLDLVERNPLADLTSPAASAELQSPPRCAAVDPADNATKLGCEAQTWLARFWAWDDGQGMAGVDVRAADSRWGDDSSAVSFSHRAFRVGARSSDPGGSGRVVVIANASCCVSAVVMRAWDVRANVVEVTARNGASGLGLLGVSVLVAFVVCRFTASRN